MAYRGAVKRWDLYWADLEPGVGSEQRGDRRPVVVVSNDGFNAAFPVVSVLPLTKLEGKRRRLYPFELTLPRGTVGNEYTSIVMPQQIRTVSKLRLLERIGVCSDPSVQDRIERRMMEHLDLEFEAEHA